NPDMLDSEIVLTGNIPQNAAHIPAAGEARIQRQRPVDQSNHGADILTEMRQHERGVDENTGIILCRLDRLPGESASFAPTCLRRFGPSGSGDLTVAHRRPGKCRSVMRIDRDRLLEQTQRLDNPLFGYWVEDRKRTQIELVGGE